MKACIEVNQLYVYLKINDGNKRIFSYVQVFSYRCIISHIGFWISNRKGYCIGYSKDTCAAIWRNAQPIYMPYPNKHICAKSAENFKCKWQFPNCWGAIDGKHIKITCPANSGSLFYNYKQFFSIVLQGVADAFCKFICIDVGAYGKESNGGVFRNSVLFHCLENNLFDCPSLQELPGTNMKLPYVLLGDEAYPLRPDLMRPYPRQNLDADKRIFNYRLSRGRCCVECAFGIITS